MLPQNITKYKDKFTVNGGVKVNKEIFVKQNHKNAKVGFLILYICYFCISISIMIINEKMKVVMIVFLIIFLFLLLYLSNLFDGFGIYINDDKVYYKTLKRKEVDINSIVGIKIIKAEGQVNVAWSSFDMKDKEGKNLYSMMFLSRIEKDMKEYPYGDLEFKRRYRQSIIMQSVYDERLFDYFKEHLISLEILD